MNRFLIVNSFCIQELRSYQKDRERFSSYLNSVRVIINLHLAMEATCCSVAITTSMSPRVVIQESWTKIHTRALYIVHSRSLVTTFKSKHLLTNICFCTTKWNVDSLCVCGRQNASVIFRLIIDLYVNALVAVRL